MHPHLHAYITACIDIYTDRLKYIHAYIHPHMHAYTTACMEIYTDRLKHIHAYIHPHTHAYKTACIDIYTDRLKYIHANIHPHIHAYITACINGRAQKGWELIPFFIFIKNKKRKGSVLTFFSFVFFLFFRTVRMGMAAWHQGVPWPVLCHRA